MIGIHGSERERLIEAADHLDYLYEGSKHIPTDLFHSAINRGWVLDRAPDSRPVAQFLYGGAAEVFLTMGPAALPLLSPLLRQVADNPTDGTVTAALTLADHILKQKE